MNSDILTKLFSSQHLIKILRLFFQNPEDVFENKDIVKRCKVSPRALRLEINILKDTKFISQKTATVVSEKTGRPKKIKGWQLNPKFPLLGPLKNLVFNTEPFKDNEIIKRFKNCGSFKLIVVAGVFVHDEDSRADLLLVGDRLKKATIEKAVRGMESEIGKELEYAIFTTGDFNYRLGAYDKFIRDILDYPHRKVLNKLTI